MKTLFAFFATSALFLTMAVEARSIQKPRILEADIHTFNVDTEGSFAGYKTQYGKISVNEINRTVTLYLSLGPKCAPGMMCPMYLIAKKIELPMISGKRDQCHVVTYVANKNDMPVDGANETLVVTDFSNNICPSFAFAAYPETKVDYISEYFDRLQGKLKREHNTFLADKLEIVQQ